MAQTLQYWNTSTTICCTVPQHKLRSDDIYSKVPHLPKQEQYWHVIQELWCPLQLSFITLSMQDGNMQHHLATCCPDITSSPYTSMNCQRMWATCTFPVHKKCINPWTSKWDQFSKTVTMFNCHTCTPSPHMSQITWPWTLSLLSHIPTAFEISLSSASQRTELVNFFFNPPLFYELLAYLCISQEQ
jgi:hypothetical protein